MCTTNSREQGKPRNERRVSGVEGGAASLTRQASRAPGLAQVSIPQEVSAAVSSRLEPSRSPAKTTADPSPGVRTAGLAPPAAGLGATGSPANQGRASGQHVL